MSHPNQAGSDSENDERGNSDDSFIEAARSLLPFLNLDLSEIPGLQGRNNQTGMDTLNLSVNPPPRDPPPPYPGVGHENLTTNESLATLESVASAVRNLDGKLNDVRDSLKNEIKSVDKKLSDIQKFIENLPNIIKGIVSKDDGETKGKS